MSIKIITNAVEDFLREDGPGVLSIKGGWGVGKTYFWNELIKIESSSKHCKLEKYAYVSMFGVTTLDELKFTIFEQTVSKSQIGQQISIENLKSNWDDLGKSLGRKLFPILQGLPWVKNHGTAIQSASFLSVRNTLVCFDDFERKGDSLSAKDILGLVSLLKEQRDCKIVMIFNDANLKDKSLKEYENFREKVIDVEVKYAPSPEEAAKLVFSGSETYKKKAQELSVSLGICNIRILNKIKKIINLALPILEGFEQEVLDQVIHTVTLAAWSYYSHEDGVPSYDYVKNIGYSLFGLDDDKEKSEEQLKWDTILTEYGFKNTDEFDLILFDVIESGYIEKESFLGIANAQNEQIKANKSQNSFSEAWDLYHNSFNDNSDELADALINALQKHGRHVTPLNMNATVRLLKQLGKTKEASDLIDGYIETNKDRTKMFDLEDYAFSGDIDDPEVISKFNKTFNESKEIKSLDDTLKSLVGKDGWGLADEEILSATSADEYYAYFKSKNTSDLPKYIKICLRFGQLINASEKQKAIANNAIEALKRIGKENKLNEIRVRRFGVKITN